MSFTKSAAAANVATGMKVEYVEQKRPVKAVTVVRTKTPSGEREVTITRGSKNGGRVLLEFHGIDMTEGDPKIIISDQYLDAFVAALKLVKEEGVA